MGKPASGVDGVLAASIDGRAHNVFHRQTQLERLHHTFRTAAPEIKEAIESDSSASTGEATIEHFACMRCVKDAHESLSPKTELENEYQIANGKDLSSNRVPVGIVVIEPLDHTFFYSVVAPLSSAIVAGNCVIIKLEQTLRTSHALLKRLLTEALEHDTIAIVNSSSAINLPESSFVKVAQKSDEPLPQVNILGSSTNAPVVATVDRTADLKQAAAELVAARFSFGGSSPYAPDVVLVNEFVKQDFLQQVVQQCIPYGRTSNDHVDSKSKKSSECSIGQALDDLRETDHNLRGIVQEERYAVVELPSRSQSLSRQNLPILVVHSVRSSDDAIELINASKSVCAATFHFGNPATGQYMSQYIPSAMSFINHVDRQILLGPRYPTGHSIDVDARYPRQLFTRPSPQLINPGKHNAKLTSILIKEKGEDLGQLTSEANASLVITKRPTGKGIGFFEQGLLLNASLILLTGLSVSAVGVYYVLKLFRK